mgnify:CR=1 FL=1|jgi:hypothetical protein|tara:strand:- start:1110 stop:1787 length:678 start_codon:yes stop_codon:yes gene_type:complete
MELQEQTLNVLKNFSDINPNILIKSGNTIKTISEAKNVLATAVVDNEFPQQFGIYDLKEFISVLSLVDKPNLKFAEESVTISDQSGRSKIRYFFSPEETLTSPQKDINMPDAEVQFTLDGDTLNKLRSAASALGHNEVSVTAGENGLTLSVVDNENATSNTYSIDVPHTSISLQKFNYVINIGNLKIIPGDYEVSISSKLISQFKHKSTNVSYWIALEKSSTIGE